MQKFSDNEDLCMLALVPSPEVQASVYDWAVVLGLDPTPQDEVHCTLAFLGEAADVDKAELLEAAIDIANQDGFVGKINGSGRFDNDETAIYIVPDVPGLDELRVWALSCLAPHGIYDASEHGFSPHITVGYGECELGLSPLVGMPLAFFELYVVYAGEWIPVPFYERSETLVNESKESSKWHQSTFDEIISDNARITCEANGTFTLEKNGGKTVGFNCAEDVIAYEAGVYSTRDSISQQEIVDSLFPQEEIDERTD